MKILPFALIACFVLTPLSLADAFVRAPMPAHALAVAADWQPPRALPRRFRNHCAIDPYSRNAYCSDHCGFDYAVYYCGHASYGCCRAGFGYCDSNGLLRCRP